MPLNVSGRVQTRPVLQYQIFHAIPISNTHTVPYQKKCNLNFIYLLLIVL